MDVAQVIGLLCGKEMSELRHLAVRNIPAWMRRYEEGSYVFGMQTERKGLVWAPAAVLAKRGRRDLPLFSTEMVRCKKKCWTR